MTERFIRDGEGTDTSMVTTMRACRNCSYGECQRCLGENCACCGANEVASYWTTDLAHWSPDLDESR